ncbi:Ferric reductase like transmembrane component [Roseivivax jejudonensis]|uniref:Ferric reductase like transmembrane component n=1 Tax=Roseivivax jejudonensis TaxID=1529041 RepID=A0A1X6ZD82_9RHOB|nr:ferric reductase-like transmembrane domain-containing protein [Roseivivax jejudonensis]SLN47659.1 Ferric reductase like transmembrane component [Roseivivax jejudonensis]
MSRLRATGVAIWAGLALLAVGPVVLAAFSPYLAYRGPLYILGGFAGIVGLSLLLTQPLLAAGDLPGARGPDGRRWHRWMGWGLVACVAAHIVGLFVTSPPDTIDALLLVAPTPFSVWGVIALWSTVATAILVALRRRMEARIWRVAHNAVALLLVVATVIHAVQIEGAMEQVSKWALGLAAIAASALAVARLRILRPLLRRRARA